MKKILTLLLLLLPAAAHAQRDTIRTPADTLRMRLDSLLVGTTRTGRRIEDQPLRIEVVGREEIEEKLLMTPGDIAMLLNETGGVRVQATAPTLGGAAVRIQGLRGRYTQILADGLPLYGEAAGLGPLQIPPMDLGQVEVIKGAASALYGAAALGGVINLLSRQPDGARELLANVTTRGGADAVAWLASSEEARLGWTVLAGGHRQRRVDVDGDSWADIPSYTRGVARPRLFWRSGKTSVLVTAGVLAEERTGGATGASSLPAEGLDTERLDGGAVASTWLGGTRFSFRLAGMRQEHTHRFTSHHEHDRHSTLFGEASLSGAWRTHTWVIGAALQHDTYATDVSGFDESSTAPGLFVQEEWTPASWLAASASGRLDHVSGHGALFSPRLSLLLRPGAWSARLSAGAGHHVPMHWIEEIDAIGLAALAGPAELDVERARAASIDVGRAYGEVELNLTVFGSIVMNAVALTGESSGAPRVQNVPGDTRTWGGEVLARARIEPVHATLSYAYVRATEPDPGTPARREVALTPRHALGFVAAYELEDRGRIGFEAYYTGRQALQDNPYRDRSRPYVIVGLLAERHFGRARVFVNLENLTDLRQSRFQPLLLPQPLATGRRTTDAWAPLDGRVINGGVRLSF